MPGASSPENEKWKRKYYEVLDRFDKKEAEWIKSEKLLSKALGRLIIMSEGQNPLIDHHLQALRVVLKEQFSYYRVESVLSELFKIVSEVESRPKKQAETNVINVSVLLDILGGIEMPKALQKKKQQLVKTVKANTELAEGLVGEIKALINEALESQQQARSGGIISRLFAKDKNSKTDNELSLLAEAISQLPLPDQLKKQNHSLAVAIKACQSEKEFSALLEQFKQITTSWEQLPVDEITIDSEPESGAITVKQKCLGQFVSRLKKLKPDLAAVQSIELSERETDDEIDQLAGVIASLIDNKNITNQSVEMLSAKEQPQLKELFIQLLEQLVVPVGLLEKADELKTYLETDNSTDWRRSLKKVIHFINEVRFQEYQDEGGYEDFLQQITLRLQEMVEFIKNENQQAEQSEGKGSALNQAVTEEVAGLREGMESAATLSELQSVVSGGLDAIGEFMLQHKQFEKERLQLAKDNLASMQEKINQLESETEVLKINLEKKNKEAMYDALTAIPNRLFYEKRVQEDIARWKRFDTPLSIAIWDVDKFKSVNDSYGHKAGDKVLKAIAQILNKRIRQTDFLARYGGEEFVMLLPGTVEEETLRLANELRRAVEDCAFHYNKEAVDITISCGISGFRQGDELGVVFERADKALYQAKESGRNKCVVAGCRTD